MTSMEKNNPLADISHDPELCDHTRATVKAVLELGDPDMLANASSAKLYNLLRATASEQNVRFAGHEMADRAPAVRELVAQQAELVMVGTEVPA